MKIIRTLALLLFITTVVGCGSSETVIKDGKVYTLKGNKIYNNNVDVSETLSTDEKISLNNILNERLAAAEAAKEKKEALEAEQKKLEEVQKKAEAKQDALEDELKAAKEKREQKEDAREDFLKANKKYRKSQAKFQKLYDKGKLSPIEEDEWALKLKELLDEKNKAEILFNSL